MQRERDALRDITSAKVNDKARQHGDHVEFCDLRWGISTEDMDSESASLKVLEVCLDEIDRSNPPIIVLLGYRYGWIPEEHLIQSITEKRKVVLDDLRLSATALEAEYGAIARRRPALVYIREIVTADAELPGVFKQEDESRHELVESLKARLAAQLNCRVTSYRVALEDGEPSARDIESFAEIVADDLLGILQDDWSRFEGMSPFQRERERQWAFIREKDDMFRAREEDVGRLVRSIESHQITLCKGVPGSGKSTLCSRISLQATEGGWDVLPFMGGLTDESNDAMDVLRNSVYYLEGILGWSHLSSATAKSIGEDGPESIPPLSEWQARFMRLATDYAKTGRRLLVVVDAVDQLFADEVRDECEFIPDGLPTSVRFFLTSAPDVSLPVENTYILQPLSDDDRRRVVEGVLERHRKELAPRVVERLLEMPASSSPYYISLVAQRLQLMDSIDFERIRDRAEKGRRIEALNSLQVEILDSCPKSLDGMCYELFMEAGKRIDGWFVAEVLNYLAVSRYGLRRSDLAALLAEDWSELKFSHLLSYLQEDFQMRTDGRIDFMHKSAREGLRARLAGNRSYDIDIVSYLDKLDPHDPLRMDEILYHVAHADKGEFFERYVNLYELGQGADSEIIEHAAASMRHLCQEEGTEWLEGLVERAADGDSWVSLYWFAVNELSDAFGPTLAEQESNLRILLKVNEQLDRLDSSGKLTAENSRAFVKRIFVAMRPVLGFYWLTAGSLKLDGIVEKYLEQAKADFKASDGGPHQRWLLLHAYHRAMQVYKATDKERSARDGMTLAGGAVKMRWNAREDNGFGDRCRKGIEIAEEGMRLFGNKLTYDASADSRILPAYFQCLGDFYRHLGRFEECLATYLVGLRLLDQRDLNVMGVDELLELGDACANVGSAYIELNDRTHSSENYTKAITCYELAGGKGAIDVSRLRTIADSYWHACWIYFSNPEDVVLESDLANQAILWGYQGCDMLRRYYRATGDKIGRVWCDENLTLILSKYPIPKGIAGRIIGMFESWVAEDENRYLLDGNTSNRGKLLVTCDYIARIIVKSELEEYYGLALAICDKGILVAKSPAFFPGHEREEISRLQELKCVISVRLDPEDDRPLLERVQIEEELFSRYGEPATRLGEACFNLASFYSYSEKHRDAASAAKWNRKAAECGHARAQYNLGLSYDSGDRVDQDYRQAAEWYRRAAEQGHADAQYCLGFDYAHGEGVVQNWSRAVYWYRQAAEQGHAKAQCNLGYCYACGKGVGQDYAEAAKWYLKAAEQGHMEAQLSLGNILKDGRGNVDRDLDAASIWLRKAAEQGSDEGRRLLSEMDMDKMMETASAVHQHAYPAPESRDGSQSDYRPLVVCVVRSLKDKRGPKLATDVSISVLNNATTSYAPDVDPDDVVAIDGAGFPSRGKRGVLYTSRGLYSSELGGGCIPYSEVLGVSPYGDGLCFQMRDGTRSIFDFGPYQNNVLEVLTQIVMSQNPKDNKSTAPNNVRPTPMAAQRSGEPFNNVGLNDPCPCGSGKKYKKCHGVPR